MGRVATARTLAVVFALAGTFAGAFEASAQATGQVTGVVRAADTQRPLPGAQVFIQGTRLGALANQDGRYLILAVPAGSHEVKVELIGYAAGTQTVTVGAGTSVVADFSLTQTAVALEELVVTGTAAEVRAREIGNALDAVTSRELEAVPVTNPENILSGRIPGLTVMQGAGQPGAGNTVRIRGQVTASSTQDPLVYVDGVRIFSDQVGTQGGARVALSPLQDIAAEDIERIEVIKGASAATLYGTEAAAGVIQIFTKRGISGAPIWNAEVSTGFNNQGRVGPEGDKWELFTRCDERMYGLNMTKSKLGQEIYFEDPTCPSSGRWFSNGPLQRYSVSVRGGAGDVTYFLSGNYADEDGTLPTQNARSGGIRANFDFKPTQSFRVAVNTAYQIRDLSFVEDGNSASGFLLNVGRGNSGNFKGGKGDDCAGVESGVTCVSNKYLFDGDNLTHTDRFTGGLTVQHDATESLTNRLAVGWDYNTIHNEWVRPWGGLRVPLGQYNDATTRHTKLSIDYAGSWRRAFGAESQWLSTFSWGGQLFKDDHRWLEVYTLNFAGPGVPTLESGSVWDPPSDFPFSETNAGAFFQEILGWKDLVFVTGGLRIDGNSAFGDDFGLQAYPKASVAYVMSDHAFWPRDLVETFKLRGAFGYSGKAPGTFDKLRTWSPISGDEGSPGFTPNDVGNSEVGPERTREIEVGFDLSALQGRAGIEATYYNTLTTDGLVGVTLPPSNGFLASRTENVGELQSTGFEFQLTGLLFRSDWMEWRARANLSFMESEALDLNCVKSETTGEEVCEEIAAGNKAMIVVGQPVPMNYGYKILNPKDIAFPQVSTTLEPIGPVFPTRLFGFSTNFTLFNRVTLDGLVEHQGGHYLPNYTGYQNARRGAWYTCYEYQQDLADYYAGNASALDGYNALTRGKCATNAYADHNSDFWLEKADFWKLRSISLTYDLPSEWVARYASRATLSVSGRNLFTWTDFTGTDPEVDDAADRMGQVSEGAGEYGRREYYTLPPFRTFLVTLRVTF